MAKLCEQKKLVKKLNNFYDLTGYSDEEARRYRLRHNGEGVPEGDFIGFLEINDLSWREKIRYWWKKDNFSKKTGFILDRRQKVIQLYERCVESGFINPPKGQEKIISITKKGEDLLHSLGFVEQVLAKYPITWDFIIKVGIGLAGTGVGTYFLIKLGNYIIHYIPH
ncbi:MAG: hypothetical protein ABSB00_00365 [Minisyncoccia bacterium]|jgi:hypothetical protein